MSKAQLVIHDITEEVPHNPRYKAIPLRGTPPWVIALHCDDAPNWDVWNLINYDLRANHISSKGCPCPTYQYYITRPGKVYKIAQEAYYTWHAGVGLATRVLYSIPDWNRAAMAVCFAHDPDVEPDLTPEQYEVGELLIAHRAVTRVIQSRDVRGHRELEGTGYRPRHPEKLRKTCPGMGVDLDGIRLRVKLLKLKLMNGEVELEVKTVVE